MIEVPIEFLKRFEDHEHNGTDSKPVSAERLSGVLPLAKGGTGAVLVDPNADRLLFWDDSAGQFTWLSLGTGLSISGTTLNGTADATTLTVTAGETLAAGEVVKLYKAVGNFASDGYNFVNGTVYAVRAAGNDTTYGDTVLGVMTTAATYLGTGTCRIVGDVTGMTGLTSASEHYLDNYSGASSAGISQTSQDATITINTETFVQLITPTSSRLDKVTMYVKRNGGGGSGITVTLKRHNTTLGTASVNPPNDNTLAERDLDFTDVRVYKGETLTLNITSDDAGTNSLYFAYKSGGSVYNGGLSGTGIAANSDLYMKVYEYTNFGKLATSAGTRKFKMGQALSATELALLIQKADAIL